MSVYHRSTAKSRILQEYRNHEEEISAALSRQMAHKAGLETEKRMRREIANSNERRRMQSINAGFEHLKALLPHSEGEKMSKATILQQTTEYIRGLHQDKAKIQAQNAYYRRLLNEISRRCNIDFEMDISLQGGSSPPLKRKKCDTESSDEGITADYDDLKFDKIQREVQQLRQKLDNEKQLRVVLEARARTLEARCFEEKLQNMNSHLDLPRLKTSPVHKVEKPVLEEIKLEKPALPVVLVSSDVEQQSLKASPPHQLEQQDMPSNVSRRNLETIVEAIRHLEGESIKTESAYDCSSQTNSEAPHPHFYAQHCEQSEKCSERDELRSQSSERDSPSVHQHHNYVRLQNAQNLHRVSSTKNTPSRASVSLSSSSSSYSDKYPAVTNVLQGGNSSQLQMYYRPGVIVQKS